MASTPTPLDDNRLNQNDESMYSAIDKVMSNREQTYEEFLKGFTHLKEKDSEEKQKACTDKLPQQNKTTGSTEETTEVSETVSIDLPHPGHSKEEENELQEEHPVPPAMKDFQTAVLQFVMLEPGQVCGWMNKAGSQSASVQIDNFIDDQIEDNGSDMENFDAGYTASFSAATADKIDVKSLQEIESKRDTESEQVSKSKEVDKEVDKEMDKHAKAEADTEINTESGEPDDIPSAQESIEAMKNILLENFLSDFCEEMGLGSMGFGAGGMGFGAMADMGFDETEGDMNADSVTFDDDPLELLLSITDTGPPTKEYVKDSISNSSKPVSKSKKKSRSKKRKKGNSAENLEQSKNKEESNKAPSKNETESKDEIRNKNEQLESGTENNSETVLESRTKNKSQSKANSGSNESNAQSMTKSNDSVDSGINIQQEQKLSADTVSKAISDIKEAEIVSVEEVSVNSSNDQNENEPAEVTEENFGGKLLYPGEVDDDDHTAGVATETKLEFKATYRELPENISASQECSNEVEAFSLDENFDYDNVELTPKYSPEDMERISTLMKANVTL